MRVALSSLAILSFVLAAPATAQPFYIAKDKAADQCQVVTEKPDANAVDVVGAGLSFATRIEAEAAIKTVRGCEGAAVGRTPAAK